jgi:hypothetical protein
MYLFILGEPAISFSLPTSFTSTLLGHQSADKLSFSTPPAFVGMYVVSGGY